MKNVIVLALNFVILCLGTAFTSAQENPASQVGTSSTKRAVKKKKTMSVPTMGALLISSDVDCTITIDVEASEFLSMDKPISVKVMPGQHLLVATSTDKRDTWKQVITLEKPEQKVISIALLPVIQAREQDEIAKRELNQAQAQETTDEADAARAKEQRKKEDAKRKEVAEAKRGQIADLRSQLSDLQNQISEDEDRIQDDEKSIQRTDEQCAQMDLPRGVPCVGEITANVARDEVRRKRQDLKELKEQSRDLEREIQEIQNR